MKKQYSKYKAGELFVVKSNLSTKDKGILNKFMVFCGGTAGEKKLKIIEGKMLQIIDVSQIPYDKWNLDKLREFLAILKKSDLSKATKNDIKKILKRFLKEYYEDWSKQFKGLQDIKGESDINEERVNANTIFTAEELEKIIRTAENLRFKALIMLMYESGGRPQEILSLRWKDINLEKGEVKLHSTKNNTIRINPIKESVIHLERYKQEYPFPNVSPNDFIFPAPKNRKEHFSVSYLSNLFNTLIKKALGRNSFPYVLRHTRATELQKKLPPKVYEKFMDHSIDTATRYSHLDKDDVREIMLEKVYHIEELTEKENKRIKKLEKEFEKHKQETNKKFFELSKKLLE